MFGSCLVEAYKTSWNNLFDDKTDWNIVTPPMPNVNDRQIKLSRGKFLSGCSGCNGTLCIRGSKQDYDDWGLEGWSGEEFFKCMQKVSAAFLSQEVVGMIEA